MLYKKCNRHHIYFHDEDPWLVCTEEYFYKNKMNKTEGLNTWCKKCTSAMTYEWQKENPEKVKISRKKDKAKPFRRKRQSDLNKLVRQSGYYKEYQKNNLDKFREYSKLRSNKNHNISKQEWIKCKEYFDNKCAYCGIPIEVHRKTIGTDFHKEHVIYDGMNDLSNCVPSCRDCNSQKWKFTLDEWYNKDNQNFNQDRLNRINKWLSENYKQYYTEKKPKKPYTYKKTNN